LLCTHLHRHVCLTRKTNGRCLETFENGDAIDRKELHFFVPWHRQLVSDMTRVQSRVGPCGICSEQWHWYRFSLEYICFPLSVSFYLCSVLLSVMKLPLERRQADEDPEPSKSSAVTAVWARWIVQCFYIFLFLLKEFLG
jgi:hypothetical protein